MMLAAGAPLMPSHRTCHGILSAGLESDGIRVAVCDFGNIRPTAFPITTEMTRIWWFNGGLMVIS